MYQPLFQNNPLPSHIQRAAAALEEMSGLSCSIQISEQNGVCHSQVLKRNIILVREIFDWPIEVSIWILAHEWGHCALNHTRPSYRQETREESRKCEIEADIYSAFFMARNQLNVDRTISFFQNFLNTDLEEPHLGGRERYLLLKKFYQVANEITIRNHRELMQFTIESAQNEYEILLHTPGIFRENRHPMIRYL